MNRFRILEKKGTYEDFTWLTDSGDKKSIKKYIPRYIVQECMFHSGAVYQGKCIEHKKDYMTCKDYIDLKEFSYLDEAKKYKRNLELEDGIVIE